MGETLLNNLFACNGLTSLVTFYSSGEYEWNS